MSLRRGYGACGARRCTVRRLLQRMTAVRLLIWMLGTKAYKSCKDITSIVGQRAVAAEFRRHATLPENSQPSNKPASNSPRMSSRQGKSGYSYAVAEP